MSGGWITVRQEELYMKARRLGDTQVISSAKAGISERSGRKIEKGERRDPRKMARWRSCSDPLAGVWEKDLRPLLEKTPSLAAITLLEHLQSLYPDHYPDKILRTVQRRVKEWRALHGPSKEVMFRQVHEAGQRGLSDFSKLKRADITIEGRPFDHLLYHFRLAQSGWSFMKVIQGGESYPALSCGLQEALQKLGRCPREHRTDSLSAAFKNLSPQDQEDMTRRYDALCRHYQMKATRNNRGKGHENGSVESPHGHLKRRIEQALLLRGSCDFKNIHAYETFIEEVVDQSNRRNAKSLKEEYPFLQPLPKTKATDYNEQRAVVSSSSTIQIKRVIYTVPSRLQGEVLNVRVYDDRLVCYLGAHYVVTLRRVRLSNKNKRGRQVDYRHVIHSLVKKPRAFRSSQLRDDLLPNDVYRSICHC